MEWFTSPGAWIALLTLTALEIVLGIDNIIFISILVSQLPSKHRQSVRLIGLGLAMITRIGLLLTLTWLMQLSAPILNILGYSFSGRDIILLLGGLFLLAKSVLEIHKSLEGIEHNVKKKSFHNGYIVVLIQIAIIDIVFSLDSVITAVGMVNEISIMVLAIVIAVGVMMFSAKAIGDFVDLHPTIKMLALAFLILIGVALIGEAFKMSIPKGYIYFAMAFSVVVEILNLKISARRKPLKLHKTLKNKDNSI